MIALEVLGFIVFGIAIGWYGHKASIRIQAWGVKMNEQDHILEDLTDPEEALEFQPGYVRASTGSGPAGAVDRRQLPFGAATK